MSPKHEARTLRTVLGFWALGREWTREDEERFISLHHLQVRLMFKRMALHKKLKDVSHREWLMETQERKNSVEAGRWKGRYTRAVKRGKLDDAVEYLKKVEVCREAISRFAAEASKLRKQYRLMSFLLRTGVRV